MPNMITTDALSAKIAPRIVAALEADKARLITLAGSNIRRGALRLAWPTIINEVPELTRLSIDLISDEFGSMNVNDLLTFLSQRMKGRIVADSPFSHEHARRALESIHAEAVPIAQQQLEESPQLEDGTFGAGPSVAGMTAHVPGVMWTALEMFAGFGADLINSHRQQIIDFAVHVTTDILQKGSELLANLHRPS
jgi:hypothetical protein